LQQSVATPHELPGPLHVVTELLHFDVTGSHDFEQHCPSEVQASPATVQITFFPPIPVVPESLVPPCPPVPVRPLPELSPHEQPGRPPTAKRSTAATKKSCFRLSMLSPFFNAGTRPGVSSAGWSARL
jgi:hypothetical protein